MGDTPEEGTESLGPSIQQLCSVSIPIAIVGSDSRVYSSKDVAGYIVDHLAFGIGPSRITRGETGLISPDGSNLNLRQVAQTLRNRLEEPITNGLDPLGSILTNKKLAQGQITLSSDNEKLNGSQSTAIVKVPVYFEDGHLRFTSSNPDEDEKNKYTIAAAVNPNLQNPEMAFPKGMSFQILQITDNAGKSLAQKASEGITMGELVVIAAARNWNLRNLNGQSVSEVINPLDIEGYE